MESGLISVNEDMEGNEEEIYETKMPTPNPITWGKKYVEANDFVIVTSTYFFPKLLDLG